MKLYISELKKKLFLYKSQKTFIIILDKNMELILTLDFIINFDLNFILGIL